MSSKTNNKGSFDVTTSRQQLRVPYTVPIARTTNAFSYSVFHDNRLAKDMTPKD